MASETADNPVGPQDSRETDRKPPSDSKPRSQSSTKKKTSRTSKTAKTTKSRRTDSKKRSNASSQAPSPSDEKPEGFHVNASRPTPPLFRAEDDEAAEGTIMQAEPAYTELDLPTDNQMLFSKTHRATFFQPTFSGRTVSAMFGYVRNPGKKNQFTRFHEGIDIRPLERDGDREPRDAVNAAGDGAVVYLCRKENASNYGKYIVIEHRLSGPPFYTLYAHLGDIQDDLEIGQSIKRGTRIGTIGRTSNEFEIDAEHAHLHFEVNLMVNRRYIEWSKHIGDGVPQHGLYNGANLLGVDPVGFYRFLQFNPDLGIGEFVTREPAAFRVLVPYQKHLSWIENYPFALTHPPDQNTVAFEIAMTYYGLPVRVTPKEASEISATRLKLLNDGLYPLTFASVKELTSHGPCKLLVSRNNRWKLSVRGRDWLKQLLY
jgi:murein DD-endopeptidase MepM/ murein hydrolase activator NlpD